MATQTITMEPLSARIPSDLYLWLAQLQVEGATTNSDKLRVLLSQLKRQHDGAFDYVAAHAWARELTHRLREALVRIEGTEGRHSEVLSTLLEQITTLMALVISHSPADCAEAVKLEDAVVRRAALLGESLLRQAAGTAHAFDPGVVKRHLSTSIELASTLNAHQGA
ncbi:MAG: hypothetical protein EOP39_07345 [Rubrivivax sp.]|nr:MAG: hypothetical protein EOP39_07345 [Rubrivivax sp.]